jgi:hypothetical protein
MEDLFCGSRKLLPSPETEASTLAEVLDPKLDGFCASRILFLGCCLVETQVSSSEQVHEELPSVALHREPLRKNDLALLERLPSCFALNMIC